MNQRALYLFLLLAGSFRFAAGQTGTTNVSEQTAIAMTRATLDFLATDAKTYGYNKTPCQPCETYAELHQFVKTNKLMRADDLIADVQKKAVTSSPTELRTYLLKRVTEGADHIHRTKLPGFAAYQQALNAAAGLQTAVPTDPSEPTNANLTAGDTGTVDAPISTDQDITKQSDASANSQSSMLTWLPWLTLVLSLLSLAGVVFLFSRRGQNQTDSMSGMNESVMDEMNRRITKLENANTNLRNQIALLDKALRQPSGVGTPVQNQPRPTQPPPTSQPIPSSTPAPTESTAQPPKAEPVSPVTAPVAALPVANTLRTPQQSSPTLFYGRTADLGDGFSVGGLSTKPDRDTVFEILRLDANRAEFQVSDNPDLQRLALSDPYSYLNDTCTYATQPRPGSRIRTERHGILSLQGEKWVITEKAQISFTG